MRCTTGKIVQQQQQQQQFLHLFQFSVRLTIKIRIQRMVIFSITLNYLPVNISLLHIFPLSGLVILYTHPILCNKEYCNYTGKSGNSTTKFADASWQDELNLTQLLMAFSFDFLYFFHQSIYNLRKGIRTKKITNASASTNARQL